MISRRRLLSLAGGMAAWSIVAGARSAPAGMLDRLFHGAASKSTVPITPNDEFYLTSYRSPPTVRVNEWRLSVTGLVERPFTLTYEQLLARPMVSEVVTLECIGNSVAGEYIGTAEWGGLSLKAVLEEAGVASSAYDVVFHAADDYSDSIRLSRAMAGDVLLVHRMNGVPLPSAHGFPARVIVPGHYGMKSVQWMTGIEVVDRDYQGYYQRKGWTDDAIVKTTSRIDTPVHGAVLRGRRHRLAGVAFAGIRGIDRVDLSFDEGASWHAAVVEPPLSSASWVVWQYEWEARSFGRQSVLVRATDGTGRMQSAEEEGPAPDGSTGLHQITVTVEA